MKLELNKTYRTRSGGSRTVVSLTAPGGFPVISMDADDLHDTEVEWHLADGRVASDSESRHDLVAENHKPREWWAETQSGVMSQSKSKPYGGKWIRVREVLEEET